MRQQKTVTYNSTQKFIVLLKYNSISKIDEHNTLFSTDFIYATCVAFKLLCINTRRKQFP